MTDARNTEVFELFPTPLMQVPQAIPATLAAVLRERFAAAASTANQRSTGLSHTALLDPADDPALGPLAQAIGPHIVAFGELLFGQRLRWAIKEMWVNVLQHGGQQGLHNHANSFVSGVLYLSASHASAQTAFSRAMGGQDFVFRNAHARAEQGRFNADKWISPAPAAGDLLLFPSYLLHEVPPNLGPERITLAFNAIPHRLDAWGYGIEFSA